MKVHAEGNQSPLHIEVKFCEWKSRYKIYSIKSFDSVSEGNGMYKVPFVLTMRSFLINNFIIWLFTNPSGCPISRSLFCSFNLNQPSINLAFSLLINLLLHFLIFFLYYSLVYSNWEAIFSGFWWVLLECPFYIGDLQEGENVRQEVLYLCFWKNKYIAFNFLGKKLVLASWYAFIDYVTFNRETPLRRIVCIPTVDM